MKIKEELEDSFLKPFSRIYFKHIKTLYGKQKDELYVPHLRASVCKEGMFGSIPR